MLAFALFLVALVVAITETIARHRSRCPECDEPIFEGDFIVYDEDEEAWLHEECFDGEVEA